MPSKEYNVKEAVAFLQSRNPDITIKEDTVYHKIDRGEIPAEKRSTPHGKRYVIQEEDLLKVRFRRPEQDNRIRPDWQKIFGQDDEFWRQWQPVTINSEEDLKRLTDIFGELVSSNGLRRLLFEKYGVWYQPLSIKQRRINGTLLGVGKSATGRDWWYPARLVNEVGWRPHSVKRKSEKD